MNKLPNSVASDSYGKYINFNNQDNGWEAGQDIPSYMTKTPPSSYSVPENINNNGNGNSKLNSSKVANNGNHHEVRLVEQIKRRRPTFSPISHRRKLSPSVKIVSDESDGVLSSIFIAVFLWYMLGVLSIATTKLLLQARVPPLYLTLQQLFLGSNLLHMMLHMRAFGSSAGLLPWPKPVVSKIPVRRIQQQNVESFRNFHLRDLILAGVYFSFGFAATNISFSGASAAFVETIKAAEPITSASTAVLWGIEVLSIPEAASLGTIVIGVLLSTLGNSSSGDVTATSTLSKSLQSCAIVMLANICFSFRGLHQKLFRNVYPKIPFDDLNLQFRMQQMGMMMLIAPVLIWDGRRILTSLWVYNQRPTLEYSLYLLGLSVVNGFSFTIYNLASTFVLTRISVVHHAALNCIRRIFAIIVTSILFRIPLTLLGSFGIMVSFGGFLSFTHYKMKRQSQPKPISTLLPMSAMTPT